MTRTLHPSLQDMLDRQVTDLPEPSRGSRPGMLDLSRNELVHPRLPGVLAGLLAAAEPENAGRYPAYRPLVDELAGLIGHRPDEVEVFPGSDDAIGVLLDALTRSRTRVILQDPNYPGYRYHATLRGLDLHPWLPRPALLRFAVQDAARAMAAHPHGIAVASDPHGMLGRSLGDAELAALVATAQLHDHLLIVDRCYQAFAPAGLDPLTGAGGAVLLGSFSKSLGLAGLRLDYVVGSPEIVAYLRRWRRAGAVSALTLHVALQALRQHRATFDELRAEVVAGRDWLAAQLVQLDPGWRPLPSDANFLTVDLRSPDAADRVVARLAEHGIAVRTHRDRPAFASLVQITAAPVEVLRRVVDPPTELAAAAGRGRWLRSGGVGMTGRILETKARCSDLAGARRALHRAGAGRWGVRRQLDTLRPDGSGVAEAAGERAEPATTGPAGSGAPAANGDLIAYHRTASGGLVLCTYAVIGVTDAAACRRGLAAVLGVHAVVDKRREVWRLGRTVVHLDEVVGLGSYVELETGTDEAGPKPELVHQEAADLLGLQPGAGSPTSYADLVARATGRRGHHEEGERA